MPIAGTTSPRFLRCLDPLLFVWKSDLLQEAARLGETTLECLLITSYTDERLETAMAMLRRLGNTVEVLLLQEPAQIKESGGEGHDDDRKAG